MLTLTDINSVQIVIYEYKTQTSNVKNTALLILKSRGGTDVIHASSSGGSGDPSPLMESGRPVARGASIEEVGAQAADVEI